MAKVIEKIGFFIHDPLSQSMAKETSSDTNKHSPQPDSESRLLFQSVLGDLQCLADSIRLDVSFTVSKLQQHLADPTIQHMTLFKPVIRYIIKT